MNCWEFKKCGREKGGAKEAELGVCTAYPDFGQSCIMVIATFCAGTLRSSSIEEKLSNCMECDFYNSEHYIKN